MENNIDARGGSGAPDLDEPARGARSISDSVFERRGLSFDMTQKGALGPPTKKGNLQN